MKMRALGETGERVSALCLGCMYFGTKVTPESSVQVLDAYRESGGQFLDTANCYAFWVPGGTGNESESLLGEWMKQRRCRQGLFVATKVGARPAAGAANQGGGRPEGLSVAVIEAALDDSLRRLRTDHVDLLYTHIPDPSTPLEETLQALDRLVRKGKVRFIGCSNEPAWRVERARTTSRQNGWPSFCCIQNRYTYLRPKPHAVLPQVCFSDETLEYAAGEPGVTLLAYSPLLGGAYSREEESLPSEYATSDSRERWKALETVAREHGESRSVIVLAWMMCGSPPLIPLVAASSPAHLREDLRAAELELEPAAMRVLTDAVG